MSKVCACGKPIENPYRGHPSVCRECHLRKTHEARATRWDYYIAYDRARSTRESRVKGRKEGVQRRREKDPEFYAKRSREWRERNPEKYRAAYIVRDQLRAGKMTKPTVCSRCGGPAPIRAYHRDLAKPLQVTWLCQVCVRDQRLIERVVARGEASWLR